MGNLLSRFLSWLAGDDMICEIHLKPLAQHNENEKVLDYQKQLERFLALSV
jgi:hypothetical protein